MSKLTWKDSDLIALMSWLDFCKTTNLSFEDTIASHLTQNRRQNCSEDHEFTALQIKNKMQGLVRVAGEHFSMDAIKKKGSKSFSGLSEVVRKGIQSELRHYKAMQGEIRQTVSTMPRRAAVKASKTISELAADDQFVPSEQQKRTEQVFLPSKDQPVQPSMKINYEPLARQQIRQQQKPRSGKVQPTPPTVSKVVAPAKQTHEEMLKQKQIEIKSMRQLWQEETEQLKEHKRRLEQVEKDLLARISHLEMAARDLGSADGRDPLEYEIYLKNKQIFAHEDRIQKMQAQMRFTNSNALLSSSSDNGRRMEIDSTMNFFQAELDSILHGHDTLTPLQIPSAVRSNDLGALIRSIHGCSGREENETTLLRRWILKFGPHVVVNTLALAAIREWVFASPFPDFVKKESLLMQAYRKALMLQDGWRNLHNLELTAYHSLIQSDNVQHTIIPTKATRYAARLSAALAVLFSPSQGQNTDSSFHTWGQSLEVCKNRQYRLTAIFEAALRLKASTVTAEQVFEFLVYPPGTSQTLDIESSAGVGGASWIHASMHTYARSHAGHRGELSGALIQTKNFVSKNIEQRERIEMSLSIRYLSTPKSEDTIDHATGRNGEGMDVCDSDAETDIGADKMVLDSGVEDEDEVEDDDAATAGSPRQAAPKTATKRLPCSPNLGRVEGDMVRKPAAASQDTTSPNKQYPDGFACPTCSKKFTMAGSLTRHRTTGICSVCPSCQKICNDKVERRKHEAEHAARNNDESELQLRPREQPEQTRSSYRSQPCSTIPYESQPRTNRHTRSMSSVLPPSFKCDLCGRDDFHDLKGVKVHKSKSHKTYGQEEKAGEPPAIEQSSLQPRTTRSGSSALETQPEQSRPDILTASKRRPQPRTFRRGSSTHEARHDQPVLQKPDSMCPKCGKYYVHSKALDTHIKNEACVQCRHCEAWIQDRGQLHQHIRRNHSLELESPSPISEGEESPDSLSRQAPAPVQYTQYPHQLRHLAPRSHDRPRNNKEVKNKSDRSNDQEQSDIVHADPPARTLTPSSNMSVVISSRRASEIHETILNRSDEIAQVHASASSLSTPHRHTIVNNTPPSHPTRAPKSFTQNVTRFGSSRQSTPGRFDRGYSRQPTPFNSDGNGYHPGANQICRRDGHLVKASDMRPGQDSGPCSRCGENTTARRIRKNLQRNAVSADTTPTKQRANMVAHQRELPELASDQPTHHLAAGPMSFEYSDSAQVHVESPQRAALAPPENLGYMSRMGRFIF